ncbi:hypothetical protein TW85_14370 [Marinomonas sp. S3726]|uniref:TRAFAC clade GTPase domain-containing protein n=1 Tax=Marinomonas sp. S3726 TaxID=579484 RepID=UPI0005F9CCE0|nr:hypothetical protein [Marinomonas sp. S3726]KJZ12802.1 hypothetical protein TW85_14370 [Marinomonas sp. S3726]
MNNDIINYSLIICGLPESGKTTFLGALAYSINSHEIETALKYDGLPSNREYLTQLSKQWLNFEVMDRTIIDSNNSIELKLKNAKDIITLSIPDLSGETWSNLWSERQVDIETSNLSKNANGIIFFLHCDKYLDAQTIVERNKQNEILEENDTLEKVNWSPSDHTPTQTKVIDILQSFNHPNMGQKKRKLVLMLSAWDRAEEVNQTPLEYLSSHFPLLSQFLEDNIYFNDIKVLGLSSLGGDLETDEEALGSIDIPTDRIKIIEDKESYNDLTLPIKWLLENNES